MIINLKQERFKTIDAAFTMLLEDVSKASPIGIIEDCLNDTFKGLNFKVSIVKPASNTPSFYMAVYPEISTADKIVYAVLNNKDYKVISELWKKNTNWKIEIDEAIITSHMFTNKELTALLLHEVGHVMSSNSIPERVSTIMKYEIASSSYQAKSYLSKEIFRRIMALPILDACVSDKVRNVKEEVKADTFAKKMGYSNELYSSLTKLQSDLKKRNTSTINDSMKEISNFSLKTLEDIGARKDNLAKDSLLKLKESAKDTYIESVIDDFIVTIFEDENNFSEGEKIKYIQEKMDELEDEYVTEFFFFKKELKRINPADLDYIQVQMSTIRSENDKMMLITYIYSKIDLIDYYISILKNPKYSKKYYVPHTLDQLQNMRKRLEAYRLDVLNYKLPERNRPYVITWPDGYEG